MEWTMRKKKLVTPVAQRKTNTTTLMCLDLRALWLEICPSFGCTLSLMVDVSHVTSESACMMAWNVSKCSRDGVAILIWTSMRQFSKIGTTECAMSGSLPINSIWTVITGSATISCMKTTENKSSSWSRVLSTRSTNSSTSITCSSQSTGKTTTLTSKY